MSAIAVMIMWLVAAVQHDVGGVEIANFGKHEFKGAGARAYLDHVLAGFVPQAGRLTLTPMLTPKASCMAI